MKKIFLVMRSGAQVEYTASGITFAAPCFVIIKTATATHWIRAVDIETVEIVEPPKRPVVKRVKELVSK